MRRRLLTTLPPLLFLLSLLGAWEAYADSGSVSAFVLPAPHAMAVALWDNGSLIWSNFLVTAEEVALGLLMALVAGSATAVAIHFSPLVRRAIYPLAVGSQALPIAVLATLLVFWWGFGIWPKLVVIALICFFPVVVTTVDGLAAVDPDQLKLLRTLDASRWQAFRAAEMPAALPAALSGTRIALAVGVIGSLLIAPYLHGSDLCVLVAAVLGDGKTGKNEGESAKDEGLNRPDEQLQAVENEEER